MRLNQGRWPLPTGYYVFAPACRRPYKQTRAARATPEPIALDACIELSRFAQQQRDFHKVPRGKVALRLPQTSPRRRGTRPPGLLLRQQPCLVVLRGPREQITRTQGLLTRTKAQIHLCQQISYPVCGQWQAGRVRGRACSKTEGSQVAPKPLLLCSATGVVQFPRMPGLMTPKGYSGRVAELQRTRANHRGGVLGTGSQRVAQIIITGSLILQPKTDPKPYLIAAPSTSPSYNHAISFVICRFRSEAASSWVCWAQRRRQTTSF